MLNWWCITWPVGCKRLNIVHKVFYFPLYTAKALRFIHYPKVSRYHIMQLQVTGPVSVYAHTTQTTLTKDTGLLPFLNTYPGWTFCDRHGSMMSLPELLVFGCSISITVGRHIVCIAKPLVNRHTGCLVTVRPSSTLRTTWCQNCIMDEVAYVQCCTVNWTVVTPWLRYERWKLDCVTGDKTARIANYVHRVTV
jgi:hypothetical protein